MPAGLDLDAVLPELKEELRREADYAREARSQEQYRALVGDDPGVLVPRVHADLSTRRVLASDRVRALPIEDLRSPEHPQRLRDEIGEKLLRLVFRELFEFRFVQTDPNFANYLYEPKHERVALLDFGAVRSFSRHFTDHYRDLIAATIAGDSASVEERGTELGLLRGDETAEARGAFAHLCARVAEPLACSGAYDFGRSHLAREVRDLGLDAYTKRGLHAPPTELIFLHRKLAGSYLLLAHIGARVDCGRVFERVRAVSERCPWAGKDPLYIPYHDGEWGVPSHDDRHLFEMLILEGAQAGLSWLTILRKRDAYRRAFDGFDPARVARYTEKRQALLLANPGIVRNRLKIAAAVDQRARLPRSRGEGRQLRQLPLVVRRREAEAEPLPPDRRRAGEAPPSRTRSRRTSPSAASSSSARRSATRTCRRSGLVNDHLTSCPRHAALAKMNWRPVARVSELRPGEARRVVLDGIEIALCNVAGEFFAVDDVCTHAYASLSDGLLSGAEIECPLHGGCFDVKTGARARRDRDRGPAPLRGARRGRRRV